MCDTLGCQDDHVTVTLGFRVAAAMAADQGEQTWAWEWPYRTAVAAQP